MRDIDGARTRLSRVLHSSDMGTHYAGCEADHTACAARVVLEALTAALAEIDRLQAVTISACDALSAAEDRIADAKMDMARRGHYDCAGLLAPEGGNDA